jgi:hypothetical protein
MKKLKRSTTVDLDTFIKNLSRRQAEISEQQKELKAQSRNILKALKAIENLPR